MVGRTVYVPPLPRDLNAGEKLKQKGRRKIRKIGESRTQNIEIRPK
jgi:hypothetical protein